VCLALTISSQSGFPRRRRHVPPLHLPQLEQLLLLNSKNCTLQNIYVQLAENFHVRETEVALLWIYRKSLKLLFPVELSGAGSIPLSSFTIAARTATTGTSEIFNNFVQVKHPSVFEIVKLGNSAENAVLLQTVTVPRMLKRFRK